MDQNRPLRMRRLRVNQTDTDMISEAQRARVECLELGSRGEVGRRCIDVEVEGDEKGGDGPMVIVNSFDGGPITAQDVQIMIQDDSKTKWYPQTKVKVIS